VSAIVVTLVIDGEPPYAIATRQIGTFHGWTDALRAARRACGRRRAPMRRAGANVYVAGPLGTAWVVS